MQMRQISLFPIIASVIFCTMTTDITIVDQNLRGSGRWVGDARGEGVLVMHVVRYHIRTRNPKESYHFYYWADWSSLLKCYVPKVRKDSKRP